MDIVLVSAPILELMLSDPRFKHMPAFNDPPKMPGVKPKPHLARKACCGRTRPQPQPLTMETPPPVIDYNQIKLRLYNMPAEDKQAFKALIGCDQVVMQFKSLTGALLRDEF